MYTERECSVDELRPDVAQQIRVQLRPSERVLLCCELDVAKSGFFEGIVSGGHGAAYNAYVLTPERVIWAVRSIGQYGDRGASLHTIELSNVVAVDEHADKDGLHVTVRESSNSWMPLGFRTGPIGQRFLGALRKAVDATKATRKASTQSSSRDIGSQLAQLANLLAGGYINQEEFEAAKRKLLS